MKSFVNENLGKLLIGAGCAVIAGGIFMKAASMHRQKQYLNEYLAYAKQLEDSILDSEEAEEESDSAPLLSEEGVLGILSIPKINLEAAVVEGTENEQIKTAIGHFSKTANPGEEGNCSLIGHRNYTFGQFFNRLDELEAGDEISIQYGAGLYTYEVTETFVVEPEEVWVLEPVEDKRMITLITCTPIRKATHRLIVRGELKTEH